MIVSTAWCKKKKNGFQACLVARSPIVAAVVAALPRRNRRNRRFFALWDMPKQSHRVHGIPVHQHIRVEKSLLESRGREWSVPYLPCRVVEEEVKVRLKKKEIYIAGDGWECAPAHPGRETPLGEPGVRANRPLYSAPSCAEAGEEISIEDKGNRSKGWVRACSRSTHPVRVSNVGRECKGLLMNTSTQNGTYISGQSGENDLCPEI